MNGYQKKRVIGCLEQDRKLSAWEIDFLESLDARGDDYVLSEKQNDVLNRIASKVEG